MDKLSQQSCQSWDQMDLFYTRALLEVTLCLQVKRIVWMLIQGCKRVFNAAHWLTDLLLLLLLCLVPDRFLLVFYFFLLFAKSPKRQTKNSFSYSMTTIFCLFRIHLACLFLCACWLVILATYFICRSYIHTSITQHIHAYAHNRWHGHFLPI